MQRLMSAVLALFAALGVSAGDRWPQFRGEDSSGVSTGKAPPLVWSETRNVRWKLPVPGQAWSSPIVWGGRAYITTAVPDRTQEAPKPGLYFGGDRYSPRDATYTWQVWSIDLASGRVLWKKDVRSAKPSTPIHLKNTYASETPATDGEHVYAWFGSAGLFCLTTAGEVVWSKEFAPYPTMAGWGGGSSPVLAGDRVLVQCDNQKSSFLAAYDKRTGNEAWRVPRSEKSSWGTPFVWKNRLRTEVVACAAESVRSYDLATGSPLWQLGPQSMVAAPTPVAGPDLLYVSSGQPLDILRRPIYAVRPGGAGMLHAPKEGVVGEGPVAWFHQYGGAYMPSPVLVDGRLYVLLDRGFLTCYDAKTGSLVYDKHRFSEKANQFTASPVAVDGRILCVGEDGAAYVVKAGAKFELERVNRLDGMFMASPAAAEGALLLRSDSHLYCIAAGG